MLKEWFAISIKIPSIIINFVDENFTIKRRMILMLSFVDCQSIAKLVNNSEQCQTIRYFSCNN